MPVRSLGTGAGWKAGARFDFFTRRQSASRRRAAEAEELAHSKT